jgi:hypothetical protein
MGRHGFSALFMGPDLPFAVCMPIGGQTAKGASDVPAKGAGTHEDL